MREDVEQHVVEDDEPVPKSLLKESSTPLFMGDSPEAIRETLRMKRMKLRNSLGCGY
jgi:hypothetical protein